MKGIYIHIPFCRQACRYCDFYFTVSLKYLDRFVDALVEEIRIKGERYSGQALETLYLGGGTPSILSPAQLEKILNAIYRHHSFQEDSEQTIECNPDDLDIFTLKNIKKAGFNRLSIGIQSFHKRDLNLMRRSHTAVQAASSVRQAASEGFENITIDLIYGIPGQLTTEWEKNIECSLSLPISHLSAYHLTFEPGTVFDHWRKKGKLIPAPEEKSVEQYRILRQKLLADGFKHYELSNFGRGETVSRHNMLYWSGKPYLGLGPAAHSFNGEQRSWNTSSLKEYMEGIETGKRIEENEELSNKERYHDYLITSLRTRWGADPVYIEETFGKEVRKHFKEQAQIFIKSGSMYQASGRLVIEPGQWLITDHILRGLFMD
jgi:oxygen-independent coproporphyrinogen-3 oxidase